MGTGWFSTATNLALPSSGSETKASTSRRIGRLRSRQFKSFKPFKSLKAVRAKKSSRSDVLAQEIVEDLEAAIEQFREIAADLGADIFTRKING